MFYLYNGSFLISNFWLELMASIILIASHVSLPSKSNTKVCFFYDFLHGMQKHFHITQLRSIVFAFFSLYYWYFFYHYWFNENAMLELTNLQNCWFANDKYKTCHYCVIGSWELLLGLSRNRWRYWRQRKSCYWNRW